MKPTAAHRSQLHNAMPRVAVWRARTNNTCDRTVRVSRFSPFNRRARALVRIARTYVSLRQPRHDRTHLKYFFCHPPRNVLRPTINFDNGDNAVDVRLTCKEFLIQLRERQGKTGALVYTCTINLSLNISRGLFFSRYRNAVVAIKRR